ncbi:MAG TPA: type II toxin-antitoxin system VapC family toxin [Thermoanaerobaculia bacterium]|nr:type II toxin-antitoxin system VapC family toxin [Thermoanaerobaculia bacterium]
MRLLLDTHAFLWWIGDDPRLPAKARKLISAGRNEVFLSAASAWELAIKTSIGRLRLAENLEEFVTEHLAVNGFQVLPVHLRHALRVSTLPDHHGDPFDRMLVAQAQIEDLILVSGDEQIARYAVTVAW